VEIDGWDQCVAWSPGSTLPSLRAAAGAIPVCSSPWATAFAWVRRALTAITDVVIVDGSTPPARRRPVQPRLSSSTAPHPQPGASSPPERIARGLRSCTSKRCGLLRGSVRHPSPYAGPTCTKAAGGAGPSPPATAPVTGSRMPPRRVRREGCEIWSPRCSRLRGVPAGTRGPSLADVLGHR